MTKTHFLQQKVNTWTSLKNIRNSLSLLFLIIMYLIKPCCVDFILIIHFIYSFIFLFCFLSKMSILASNKDMAQVVEILPPGNTRTCFCRTFNTMVVNGLVTQGDKLWATMVWPSYPRIFFLVSALHRLMDIVEHLWKINQWFSARLQYLHC